MQRTEPSSIKVTLYLISLFSASLFSAAGLDWELQLTATNNNEVNNTPRIFSRFTIGSNFRIYYEFFCMFINIIYRSLFYHLAQFNRLFNLIKSTTNLNCSFKMIIKAWTTSSGN